MKKTYLIPQTQVYRVAVQRMVADSFRLNATGSDGTQLGREDNLWDIWGSKDDEE